MENDYDIDQGGKKVGSVSIKYYGPFFMNEADFNFITVMNTILLVIGIFSSACAVVVGCLLARRIPGRSQRPHILQSRYQGNYELRFEPGTRIRELDDLGTAINQLSGALSEQENLRKRMTADVAHELRTPNGPGLSSGGHD